MSMYLDIDDFPSSNATDENISDTEYEGNVLCRPVKRTPLQWTEEFVYKIFRCA